MNLQLRRVVVVAVVAAVLPTPAVTTTEFKPKEAPEKLKKTVLVSNQNYDKKPHVTGNRTPTYPPIPPNLT